MACLFAGCWLAPAIWLKAGKEGRGVGGWGGLKSSLKPGGPPVGYANCYTQQQLTVLREYRGTNASTRSICQRLHHE